MVDSVSQAIVAVVDDDPRVLESIESVLASAGHDVRVFESASAFLASQDFARIACLISDIGMPVIDGYELQRIVHNIRPEIAVIFITGDPERQIDGRRAGIPHCGIFPKPFHGEELLTAVDKALHRQSHG